LNGLKSNVRTSHWLNKLEQIGTNNEGLKKKLEFKGNYSIVSSSMWWKTKLLYLWHFFGTIRNILVENWRAIAFEYFCNKRLYGTLGNKSSWAKKGIAFCLGDDQSMCQTINVNYQGLTKSPHEILEIVRVKLTHNLDWVWISSKHEHLGCYFPPLQHQFAFQEHPIVIIEP
jgi:hypothetical protein